MPRDAAPWSAGRAIGATIAMLLGGALIGGCGASHGAAGTTGATSSSAAATAGCAKGAAASGFTLAVAQEKNSTVATPTGKCWGAIKYTGMPNVSTGTPPAGVTGQFKVAWNAQDLYVLAWIQEWPLHNGSSSAWHQDDTVEFYVSGDDQKSSSYGPNDCQVEVKYTGTMSPNATCNTGKNFTPVTKVVTNKGYYDELIAPWSTLQVNKAASGQQYAFTIAYDIGNSGGSRVAQMQWAGGANDNWNKTADWGTITLQ